MVKARPVLFIACMIILVAINGVAAGAAAKIAPKAKTEKMAPTNIGPTPVAIAGITPWGQDRGDPARSGRSPFKGPGANLTETASASIEEGGQLHISLPGISVPGILEGGGNGEISYTTSALTTLRVGPANRIYFVVMGSEEIGCYDLVSYKLAKGEEWRHPQLETTYGINTDGDVYDSCIYDIDHAGLRRIEKAGDVGWIQLGTDPWINSVMCVGENIYACTMSEVDKGNICAFNADGDLVWSQQWSGPVPEAAAEDAEGCVYYLTDGNIVHKRNPDGSIVWNFSIANVRTPVPSMKDIEGGPIVGDDGRIWVCLSYVPSSKEFVGNGLPYVVLNADGTKFKAGTYPPHKEPVFACYGANADFYILFKDNTLTCYSNWDQPEWTTEIGNANPVWDMVMDSDNLIYINYTAEGIQAFEPKQYISVIDPSDGKVLKTVMLDIPDGVVSATGDLALGNGKLFYLNEVGIIKEFSMGIAKKLGLGKMQLY